MRIAIVSLLGCFVCVGCDNGSPANPSDGGAVGSTGGSTSRTKASSKTSSEEGGASGDDSTTSTKSTPVGGSTSKPRTTTSANTAKGGAASTETKGTTTARGGATSSTPTSSEPVGPRPRSYALDPPNQCLNQQSINNCKKGDASSACGGVCNQDYGSGSASACESGKTGVPINFACPRFLLFSDEFLQAASDDGNTTFNYGIVGHDVDKGGVDGTNADACCQCYQIIFDYPKENQVWVDPNDSANPVTAVPPPKPMIVQSFNTGTAGPGNFAIYMGAGGLGANNGCFSVGGSKSPAGLYQYTGYPAAGQPGGGGVKAAGEFGNQSACKTNTAWVTEESISSAGCVEKVTAACNEIEAVDAAQQAAARRSCIQSNAVDTFYHLNWYFWVQRVECPAHLTEVTGCKLASQGLPKPDPKVTTVAQAKAAGFRQKDSSNQQYFTTTMEDCCMPTCAWVNNVKGTTVDKYNSFYSCNQ